MDLLSLPQKPTRELTAQEFGALSPQQLSALRLRASNAAGAGSLQGLQDLMLDFIHLQTSFNTPPKLSTLNRRFGRACKAQGSTALGVIEQLVMQDAVQTREHRGSTVVFSNRCMLERAQHFGGDELSFAEMRDLMLNQAE